MCLGVFLGLNVLVKVDVCVCSYASPSLCMKTMCLDESDCISRGGLWAFGMDAYSCLSSVLLCLYTIAYIQVAALDPEWLKGLFLCMSWLYGSVLMCIFEYEFCICVLV